MKKSKADELVLNWYLTQYYAPFFHIIKEIGVEVSTLYLRASLILIPKGFEPA